MYVNSTFSLIMMSFHLLHTSLQPVNSSTRGSWQNTTSRTSQGSQFRDGSSDSTSQMKLSEKRTEQQTQILQIIGSDIIFL